MFHHTKQSHYIIAGITVIIGVACVIIPQAVQAVWLEPDSTPTNEQFDAPITAGSENQTKKGYIELDPDYSPTDETSFSFGPERPLHVHGEGARFDVPTTYSDILTVDTDTLYANAIYDWVSIGTTAMRDDYLFAVEGGTVQIGTNDESVAGRGLSAYSSDSVGIYADAGGTGTAGVYGLRLLGNGLGVRGTSQTGVGVRGESPDGYGIYAETASATNAAVYGENALGGWAGYFDGRLGSDADIAGAQFLSTKLGSSLIPQTSGYKVGTYQISDGPVSGGIADLVFDGTYLWATNKYGTIDDEHDRNLFKMRASDGELVQSYYIDEWPHRMAYDGRYLWLGYYHGNALFKVDPQTGEKMADCSTVPSPRDPLMYWGTSESPGLATSVEDGDVYIWTANDRGGDVTKFDQGCNLVGVYPAGTTGEGNYENRLNSDGERLSVSNAIYADEYIWVLTPNICREAGATPSTNPFISASAIRYCSDDTHCPAGDGYDGCIDQPTQLVKMDATTGVVLDSYDIGMTHPAQIVFDGVYLWIANATAPASQTYIAKVRASDGQWMGYIDVPSPVTDLVFDGTYIWASGNGNPTGSMYRIPASETDFSSPDISTYTNTLLTGWWDGDLVFDGTYIWHLSQCAEDPSGPGCYSNCDEYPPGSGNTNCPLSVTKHFSGAGPGTVDTGSSVVLRQRTGVCMDLSQPTIESIYTEIECVYDSHCPNSWPCSTQYSSQSGNMNITGGLVAQIDHCESDGTHYYSRACDEDADCDGLTNGQCVGGGGRVGTDVKADNNVWGGTDDVQALNAAGDTAVCAAGQFAKGLTIDSNGKITQMICREL